MTLKPVDYDQRQHQVYAQARAIAPDMLDQWMDVFAGVLPDRRPLAILDLGSGSGRFTPALAARFGGPVTGVEPSAAMRQIAEAQGPAPNLRYLAGDASAIPLDDASADAVLMFLSFHHFPDKALAARQIARVLRPGGRVLLRGVFSDRSPGEWWNPFFPRLEEIGRRMFPTLAEATEAFAAAGLRPLDLIEVTERYSANEAEALERLKLKGISTFEHLTETELTEGFAALDRAVAAGTLRIPLTGRSDLLVLGGDL
jgi:ubiquinone/menaquinone biosynthesis C-methylase UbiE